MPFSRTVLGDFVVSVLNKITAWLNEDFVTRSINTCRNAGQLAILLGGILGVAYCIVTAIRTNQLIPALVGIGFVAALAIGQFVAMRFLEANDTLISNTPHRVSSKAFFECMGLIALLLSLGLLAMGALAAIQLGKQGGLGVFVPAVMASIVFAFKSAIAFNPRLINIAPGGGSSGEEAVGILGFFLKTELKLLPVSFLVVGATADFDIIRSFASGSGPLDIMGAGELNNLATVFGGYSGLALLLIACLLPLVGYILFLIFNLALEIARAILSLTGK